VDQEHEYICSQEDFKWLQRVNLVVEQEVKSPVAENVLDVMVKE
jgi:hypothetical protein